MFYRSSHRIRKQYFTNQLIHIGIEQGLQTVKSLNKARQTVVEASMTEAL
jgi:hypothetical protein